YLKGKHTSIDPTKTGDSKKEIIELLNQAFNYAKQTVDGLQEKDLNEPVDFFAGMMSRRRILLLMTDHVTHHRGQLGVYLRLNDVVPPSYRGW
ncbi:MAG: DinB family protein, partial [Saprospiraceae bacterium]